jgi:hypothetical protein
VGAHLDERGGELLVVADRAEEAARVELLAREDLAR